jgi:hypothetical protein
MATEYRRCSVCLNSCRVNPIQRFFTSGSQGVLHYNDRQLVWARNRLVVAVVIRPKLMFATKANSGSSEDQVQPGETKELFFKDGGAKWFYMGTYKCLGIRDVSLAQVTALGKDVSTTNLDH